MRNQHGESKHTGKDEHTFYSITFNGHDRKREQPKWHFSISPKTVVCCPQLKMPRFIYFLFEESIQRGKQREQKMWKGRERGWCMTPKTACAPAPEWFCVYFSLLFLSYCLPLTVPILKPPRPWFCLHHLKKKKKRNISAFYLVIMSYLIFFCLPSKKKHCLFSFKVKVIRNGEEISRFLSLSQQVWNYIKSEACAVFLAKEAAH